MQVVQHNSDQFGKFIGNGFNDIYVVRVLAVRVPHPIQPDLLIPAVRNLATPST
jgi:hypothetical protein